MLCMLKNSKEFARINLLIYNDFNKKNNEF